MAQPPPPPSTSSSSLPASAATATVGSASTMPMLSPLVGGAAHSPSLASTEMPDAPRWPRQKPALTAFLDAHMLAQAHVPLSASPAHTMAAYRAYRDKARRPVLATYHIIGFISSGTYGRVYKARLRSPPPPPALLQPTVPPSPASDASSPLFATTGTAVPSPATTLTAPPSPRQQQLQQAPPGQIYAIKKFKPDSKESEASQYTGISQSAMREIALNRELHHENVVSLFEVRLEDKSIYMVFEYAEHDLLQLIHHHSAVLRAPISAGVLKSILWQLLNGVAYLHANWVLHRDLKPANILVTSNGVVKIGDLGLARLYSEPLQSLYTGDKVVVTIWYRAPELLLGARHYTTAIDVWAVGCIWGELLALRPMFKGEEAKMDPKTKAAPFQTDQLKRIVEILGSPSKERWAGIDTMPDYKGWWPHLRLDNYPKNLHTWYSNRARAQGGYELFDTLLQYDPVKRLTAAEALRHPWFTSEEPRPTLNAFASLPKPLGTYPTRRVIHDDADPKMKSSAAPPVAGTGQPLGGGYGLSGTAAAAGSSRIGGSGAPAGLGIQATGNQPASLQTYNSGGASRVGSVLDPLAAPNITVTGVGGGSVAASSVSAASTGGPLSVGGGGGGGGGSAAPAGATAATSTTNNAAAAAAGKGGMVGAATANASRSKRQKLG